MLARLACRTRGSPASARRQRGQVLILFVMGATVIFVIGAIVVDIGLWVSERRNAQAAADLASLAAATQLRNANANADAQAKGLDFAKRNGFDDADSNIDVQVKPDTTNETVEVTIDEQGVSLFAGIFGITSPHVGASAVAAYGASPPGPDIALFASSDNCSAGETLDIQAQHLNVNGSTHSNARLFVDGPQDDFIGPVTWVCPNGFTNNHNNNTYQPPPRMVGNQAMPINPVNWSGIPCDATFADVVIENEPTLWVNNNPGSGQLQSKVICATGDITLNRSGTHGHASFFAQGRVTISGSDNQLQWADSLVGTPLQQLLAYSSLSADPAINISAPGGVYTGYLHAPNGAVWIDGSHTGSGRFFLEGSIVAKSIRITGNLFQFNGAGLPGPPGPPQVHLED